MDCQLKGSETTNVTKSVCNSGILGCWSALKIAGLTNEEDPQESSTGVSNTLVPALLGNDGLTSVSKSRAVLRRLKPPWLKGHVTVQVLAQSVLTCSSCSHRQHDLNVNMATLRHCISATIILRAVSLFWFPWWMMHFAVPVSDCVLRVNAAASTRSLCACHLRYFLQVCARCRQDVEEITAQGRREWYKKKKNSDTVDLKLMFKKRKPFSKTVNRLSLQATNRNKSGMDVMTVRTPNSTRCTHLPAAQQPDTQLSCKCPEARHQTRWTCSTANSTSRSSLQIYRKRL